MTEKECQVNECNRRPVIRKTHCLIHISEAFQG